MKASLSSLATFYNNWTWSYWSLALVKSHTSKTFFFFSVLSYCLLNKANTTFIYGEKKTQNCCSVHTIKHFYKMLPLFMPFHPTRDNVLSFFSTYPNSTHHLRLRPDVISTRILPLISSSGSEPSFPGNLAVLNFDSFYHSFHTPCVLKWLLCLTLLSDRRSLKIESLCISQPSQSFIQ